MNLISGTTAQSSVLPAVTGEIQQEAIWLFGRIYLISLGSSRIAPYWREQSQSAWVTTRTRLLSGICCTTNILEHKQATATQRRRDRLWRITRHQLTLHSTEHSLTCGLVMSVSRLLDFTINQIKEKWRGRVEEKCVSVWETYFWQRPHLIRLFASLTDGSYMKPGYSVSQGRNGSTFFCLWAETHTHTHY